MDSPSAAGLTSQPLRERMRHLGRHLRWHRRKLAAVCAGIAVFSALEVFRPTPPATTLVVTARHDLNAGATVRTEDLAMRSFPTALAPHYALLDPRAAVGRTLTAAIAQGSALTELAMTSSAWQHLEAGQAAVAVRLRDDTTAALLQPGHHVRLAAVDPQHPDQPSTLTADATVLAVPERDPQVSNAQQGRVVVFAVPSELSESVAAQSVSRYLVAIWES